MPELIVCVESGSVEGSDSERLSVTPPLLNLLYLQFGGVYVGSLTCDGGNEAFGDDSSTDVIPLFILGLSGIIVSGV